MKGKQIISAVLAAALGVGTLGAIPARATDNVPDYTREQGYKLVWSDEFEGDTLNRDNWNVELHDPGWVNAEWQAYVDSEDNIKVEDGKLKLIPQEHTETLVGQQQLLTNPDFSNGFNGWTETIANWDASAPLADGSSSVADNAITYTITKPGSEDWHVQLKQPNLTLHSGVTYHVSFKAASSVNGTIKSLLQHDGSNDSDWTGYGGDEAIALTAGGTTDVSFDVTPNRNDNNVQFVVSMGTIVAGLEEAAQDPAQAAAPKMEEETLPASEEAEQVPEDVEETVDAQDACNQVEDPSEDLSAVPEDVEDEVQPQEADEEVQMASNPTGSGIRVTLSDFSITYEADGQGPSSYTSGRVNTQNKHAFTYGFFECRAKVPEGRGYLPAFWLMANDENVYGQWPRCGEIDCMEVMGQETDKVYGTIHFGNPHSESQGTKTLTDTSFSAGFHTFGCEWLPGCIRWYVDGELFHEESNWYSTTVGQGTLTYPAPFDQPFYVILNLAVGGSWVGNPDESTTYGPDNAYEVEYVRVYQLDSYDDQGLERPETPFQPSEPDDQGNYVRNGSYAVAEDLSDDTDWKFMTAQGGEAQAAIEDGVMTVTTANAGSVDYSVQLVQAGLPFEKGATYEVSYDAWASAERTMNVDVKAPDHGYAAYKPTQNPALTTQPQTFTQTFKMTAASDANGRLEFNMGAGSDATVYIDNVSVKKIDEADPNEKDPKTVLANGNYIYNGSFQEGMNHLGEWTLSDPAAASVTGYADGRRLKVTAPVTLSQTDLTFEAGTPYALSFEAQAEHAGDKVTVTVGGQSFTATLSGEKQTYSFALPASAQYTDRTFTADFAVTGDVWLDNVQLCEDCLIKNGSFNNGTAGYEVYVDTSASASYVVDSLSEDNALDVTVNNTADQDWKIQVKQNNVPLVQGKTYTLSFRAKSSVERPIRVVMQGLEPLGWPVYSSGENVNLTSEYQTFTERFTMNAATDPKAFLSICLGKVGDFQSADSHRVCIDDITLTEEAPPVVETPVIRAENVTLNAGNPVYNGKAHTPAVAVTMDGAPVSPDCYDVTYQNNVNAGKATVTVTGKGSLKGTVKRTFTIAKANQKLTVSGMKTMHPGESLQLKLSGVGALTCKSNSARVAVTNSGKLTAKSAGKVNITVKAAGNRNYNPASKTVAVTVVNYAAPKVTKLENVSGGLKLTYQKAPGVKKVQILARQGSGKWTVVGTSTSNSFLWKNAGYGKTYSMSVRCLGPDGKTVASSQSKRSSAITRLTAPKVNSTKSRTATVSWAKADGATGCQIQYSTSKTFQSNVRTATVKGKTSLTLTGLQGGKTYYVRLRITKTAGGKTVQSNWSLARAVTVKK